MLVRVARSLLIVLTILGILMPRISAAIAFAASGVETVVICTGDGLRTIRIDADGNPVPVTEHPDHCLFAHVADTAVRAVPPALPATLVATVPRRSGDLVVLSAERAVRPPPRAPPAA